MFFIDSHCHLDTQHMNVPFAPVSGDGTTDAVIQRAFDAGVKYMLNIGTKLSDVERLRDISNRYDNIFRTVGIHPLEAFDHAETYTNDDIIQIIESHCKMQKTVGIGEIGLDYHYDPDHAKVQQNLFHLQLDIATQCNLPVSIHSRDAYEDTISILSDHRNVMGVMHCFSGTKEFARQVLDLGYYISISGIVTYKKSTELQEIVKYLPLDRVLIETDSPFLAPVPHRGKMNEPAFVRFIAQKIAEIVSVPIADVALRTSENFFDLFSDLEAINSF